ncbi:MAG: SWIM zinc finger family protein [Pseudonocardia sp.]
MTAARGFPAFPRRPGRRGHSWWARAFVTAMEDAACDAGLLRRGQRFAGSGRLGPISVSPGRIAAVVDDPDDTYDAIVHLRELTDAEWDRFLDQVTAEAGHLAALLDGEMPQSLVRSADAVDVPLLPTIGELETDCDCPEVGDPCLHAAALCYQAAWLLDDDPLVLLLLRGRGPDELLAAPHRRPQAAPTRDPDRTQTPEDGRIPAAQAYAATTPDLPAPGPPPATRTAPTLPAAPGLPPDAVALLVADAAARARALLGGDAIPSDPWTDAVRWAATYPQVAARIGVETGRAAELGPATRAWKLGGETGLTVLHRLQQGLAPTPEEKAAIPDAAAGNVTLRRGPDGRWYPFRCTGGQWWPAAAPDHDADTARDALGCDAR